MGIAKATEDRTVRQGDNTEKANTSARVTGTAYACPLFLSVFLPFFEAWIGTTGWYAQTLYIALCTERGMKRTRYVQSVRR